MLISMRTNEKDMQGLRLSRGFTQDEVADLVRVYFSKEGRASMCSKASIHNYETGVSVPRVRTARALAAVYKVPVDLIWEALRLTRAAHPLAMLPGQRLHQARRARRLAQQQQTGPHPYRGHSGAREQIASG